MTSYKLGQFLRNRYQRFLGDLYTSGIVDPISTASERTRMSLLLVLAGLFPPASSQKWHDSFNWLPIPYNYQESSRDFVSFGNNPAFELTAIFLVVFTSSFILLPCLQQRAEKSYSICRNSEIYQRSF